jgi:hypothetical protein
MKRNWTIFHLAIPRYPWLTGNMAVQGSRKVGFSAKRIFILTHALIQFTLYTSVDSQWVGVPHLTILEKGYKDAEFELEEVSLRTHFPFLTPLDHEID